MKTLTLRREWLEPGYVPDSLYEAPFEEMTNRPFFQDVADAEVDHSPYEGSLGLFAAELITVLDEQLDALNGPVHCLLSGGYDSRILAFLLEEAGIEPLYVTDGTEEPECGATLDLLGVPDERRHVYDLDQPDPYGLVDAECEGFAPLYSQMRFFPADPEAVLVTGLGGGEWFSYPAGGWHRGKKPRVPHTNLVNQWLDCWPQYTLLPDAWRRGYRDSLNPYCTPEYARVAARCRPEWLVEVNPAKGLDMVRKAMLDSLDTRLAGLGWVPHDYDWHLSEDDCYSIDIRFAASWLARTFGLVGRPSQMDRDDHACTLAGFATWCDRLIGRGYAIS